MADHHGEVERGERLARVEEQVKGVREDFAEFRTEMRTMWAAMIEQQVTRSELDSQFALRDQRITQLEQAVQEIKQEKKRTVGYKVVIWTTLGGATLGALLMGFIEWLLKRG